MRKLLALFVLCCLLSGCSAIQEAFRLQSITTGQQVLSSILH